MKARSPLRSPSRIPASPRKKRSAGSRTSFSTNGWPPTRAASSFFPHEFSIGDPHSGVLKQHFQIDPADSWLRRRVREKAADLRAGWEDSTLGNIYAAHCIRGDDRRTCTPCAAASST
jgi:hypothetical protein